MKKLTINQLFVDAELAKAREILLETASSKQRIDRLVNEVVAPRMSHINTVTGQENDARYFAYLLEYLLSNQQ